MSKLLKYEFRKTMGLKWILLALTLAAEAAFLIGVAMSNEKVYAVSTGILVILASTGVMVIGLYSVMVLHRDMNTKQSYMLFMTPNSSYTILGAKVLENGLSTLLAGGFYFGLAALDVTVLLAKEGKLDQIWKMLSDVLRTLNERIVFDAPTVGTFFLMMLTGWFAFVTLMYLADVISSALLNGKKFNGLVTILLIIALEVGINWILNTALDGMRNLPTISTFLISSGIELGIAVLMYFITAWIMERRLSV